MALPRGVVKADNGAVFMRRTPDELAPWSDQELRARLTFVKAYTSPDGAGLAYIRSEVRRVAVAERRKLEEEMARRSSAR